MPVLADINEIHRVLAQLAGKHFSEQSVKEMDTLAAFSCAVRAKGKPALSGFDPYERRLGRRAGRLSGSCLPMIEGIFILMEVSAICCLHIRRVLLHCLPGDRVRRRGQTCKDANHFLNSKNARIANEALLM